MCGSWMVIYHCRHPLKEANKTRYLKWWFIKMSHIKQNDVSIWGGNYGTVCTQYITLQEEDKTLHSLISYNVYKHVHRRCALNKPTRQMRIKLYSTIDMLPLNLHLCT